MGDPQHTVVRNAEGTPLILFLKSTTSASAIDQESDSLSSLSYHHAGMR